MSADWRSFFRPTDDKTMPPAFGRGAVELSVPRDDGHQLVIVLSGIAAEIGVELAIACVNGEGEVVAAVLVLLLPDAADFDTAATGRLGEEAIDRSLGVGAVEFFTENIEVVCDRCDVAGERVVVVEADEVDEIGHGGVSLVCVADGHDRAAGRRADCTRRGRADAEHRRQQGICFARNGVRQGKFVDECGCCQTGRPQ